jgi:hypothetical protein
MSERYPSQERNTCPRQRPELQIRVLLPYLDRKCKVEHLLSVIASSAMIASTPVGSSSLRASGTLR